ncbi:F-box only protein 46 [Apodemus speciosus]|uniref:F-box only protein 46 n=1 Tax=Apodemus speciosus TaxID=105296 RepID=A0ABQ0EX67_APOSI
MDRGSLLPFQLWCPQPFKYSQNQPHPPSAALKSPVCPDTGSRTEPDHRPAHLENTPPALAAEAPASQHAPLLSAAASGDEGRVLLDTWYVIKPGNTKEKVAFFVAHQCGGGSRASPATSMKVKGHWGSDSSKAKRRRRCLEPTKAPPDQGGREGTPATEVAPASSGDDVALPSVAEMVALVEQRAALARQSYPRPRTPAPVVFVSAEQGAPAKGLGSERRSGGGDCSRVAEAVAHFEAQRDNRPTKGLHKEERPGPGPGEVRIAFRISNVREPHSPDGSLPSAGGGRPGCAYPGSPGPGTRAKDKITCDLYQLISPSRNALPSNVEFLLARADESTEGETPAPARPEDTPPTPPPPSARDCGASGFHVDVVVTGAVDACIFFGKDGTKNVQEETVCLTMSPTMSPEEPPPPGQLFFLQPHGSEGPPEPPPANTPSTVPGPEDSEGTTDTSLCRLYRHVSHDFLEIRFKIQRLLEPRQYMLLLPDHVLVKIFSCLPTRDLAALKCTCHYFKGIIEAFGVRATDSRWSRDPLYRDDPCKQCRKRYEKGDVSLCRWHPKPYHHDLPYGRSYWMCCRSADRETPGCRLGLHDNNWVQPCSGASGGRAGREEGR